MSIKSEIERIRANVAAAYTEVSGKGGTVPAAETSANLASAIGTIPTGVDTSDATAAAGDILGGMTAYGSGQKITGTMPQWAARDVSLTPLKPLVTFNKGYYDAPSSISVSSEEVAIAPTKEQQVINAQKKFYSKVTVDSIPDEYADVSGVTATPEWVVGGEKFVDSTGELVTGTMPVNLPVEAILTPTRQPLYTIPKGYHNGEGTVAISPEDKTVTPSKETQTVIARAGRVLQNVTVKPIPDAYQDVSAVTATASDVLSGKKIVDSSGILIAGNIPSIAPVNTDITVENQQYTIPRGYHDGRGHVGVTLERHKVTPTKDVVKVVPDEGLISEVTVAAIPDNYIDTSDATAQASQILSGATAYVGGSKVTGTMALGFRLAELRAIGTDEVMMQVGGGGNTEVEGYGKIVFSKDLKLVLENSTADNWIYVTPSDKTTIENSQKAIGTNGARVYIDGLMLHYSTTAKRFNAEGIYGTIYSKTQQNTAPALCTSGNIQSAMYDQVIFDTSTDEWSASVFTDPSLSDSAKFYGRFANSIYRVFVFSKPNT